MPAKLLEIERTAVHLRSWLPITPDRVEDDQRPPWAVERGPQVAAEAVLDSSEYAVWARPKVNIDHGTFEDHCSSAPYRASEERREPCPGFEAGFSGALRGR